MISLSGISIFLFGNKLVDGEIVEANGLVREFEISNENGNFCIPIGCTGYATKVISDLILDSPDKYYEDCRVVVPLIEKLADSSIPLAEKVDVVIKILNEVAQ